MPVEDNRRPGPNGFSASIPIGPIGIGGTYYWNPGSPTAPSVTVTGGLGMGGGGAHLVFLRKGMTSSDTLGYGATADIAPTIFPSATINASIPDENFIPQPWKAKVSSIEAGASLPGFAATYTWSPQQIADFMTTHGLTGAGRLISPATGPGPDDELSPFARTLRSGVGTVGAPSAPPVSYLGSRSQDRLGNGMGDWRASTAPIESQSPRRHRRNPAGCSASCRITCATIESATLRAFDHGTKFQLCSFSR